MDCIHQDPWLLFKTQVRMYHPPSTGERAVICITSAIILAYEYAPTVKLRVIQCSNGMFSFVDRAETYRGIAHGATLRILRDLDELHVTNLSEMVLQKLLRKRLLDEKKCKQFNCVGQAGKRVDVILLLRPI